MSTNKNRKKNGNKLATDEKERNEGLMQKEVKIILTENK